MVEVRAQLRRIDRRQGVPAAEERRHGHGSSRQRAQLRYRPAVARHRQHFAALDPFKHLAALVTQVPDGYLDHAGDCITGETLATS